MENQLDSLVRLRKQLHRYPELSGNEINTPKVILNYLHDYFPDDIISDLGSTGLALIYNGKEAGPTVMFRCELDALPIEEKNKIDHRSFYKEISHKCGHDGHMTIVTGLAQYVSEHRPDKGRVVLLFQPAEETGAGATQVLASKNWKAIEPDYIFSSHNIPGYEMGKIIARDNVFCAASTGVDINLKGYTSHAAEPENGMSPANAMSKIIQYLNEMPNLHAFHDFVMVTTVHASLGERAYGVTPGKANVMATLRSYEDQDLEVLCQLLELKVNKLAKADGLYVKLSYDDVFPSTVNHQQSVSLIRNAAQRAGFNLLEKEEPIRWSEDFGNYLKTCEGALFGLGAGIYTPDLHNENYDFPDQLIPYGLTIYKNLVEDILGF
jgi:amidohydrolase